jgi:diaminohydroxyphosphoribosylaminopyrimidine deaminase/5-amino-6-(5-phosphoribosylamino)uracil reductase
MTNVLVEGGPGILGSFLDERLIDEVHAFIAPKLIGGDAALSPIGGRGVEQMSKALKLKEPRVEMIGEDVLVHGFL